MSAPKQTRVFSLDDHPLLHQGFATIITTQSDMLLVAEASKGRDAVHRYRENFRDVTLMDLRLPDMSGIDDMIAIRSEFPEARIIILTTFAGDADIRRALEAGARPCVLKGCRQRNWWRRFVKCMLVSSEFRQIAAHLAEHYSDEALTGREIEVLWQIAGDNRNRDIAENLFITAQTVNVHMKHIIKLRFQRSLETGKRQ